MRTSITRRTALRRLTGAAALAATVQSLGSRLAAADTAASLKGRINHSVCKWCYPKLSLDELCQAAKSIGLSSIELVGPSDWPTLKKYGITCAMANGADTGIREGWNRLENHANLIERYSRVIPQAADAGLSNLICLSGTRRGMSDEEGLKNCAAGLKQIMALAEKHRVTIVLASLRAAVRICDV
jgi:hydroxypyruvate isomerase